LQEKGQKQRDVEYRKDGNQPRTAKERNRTETKTHSCFALYNALEVPLLHLHDLLHSSLVVVQQVLLMPVAQFNVSLKDVTKRLQLVRHPFFLEFREMLRARAQHGQISAEKTVKKVA
jgi:hypothetical protein